MSWFRRARSALGVVVVLATCLTGCGFHLRGDVTYPPAMAVTYIDATDPYTPFYRKLKAALRQSGVTVTADPSAARAPSCAFFEDESGQRVLSVSARNMPNEYDVYYIVRYSLEHRRPGGAARAAARARPRLHLRRDAGARQGRGVGQ